MTEVHFTVVIVFLTILLGLCAQAVGVQVRDSYDFLGKSRFSNVSIFEMLGPFPNNTPRWYPQETDYTLPKFNLSKVSPDRNYTDVSSRMLCTIWCRCQAWFFVSFVVPQVLVDTWGFHIYTKPNMIVFNSITVRKLKIVQI